MGRLDGKIAIVTGGARGIGRAIVEKFALEGATVAVFDVLGDAGPRVDVTVDADVAAAVRRVEHEFGGVDVLVNNAGVNAYYDATTMTEAEWERVFAVDLKGAWLCAKHVLPGMAQRGRGAIVNIASIHASLTIAGMFPYAAAKSGLVGLSRSLALDYAPKKAVGLDGALSKLAHQTYGTALLFVVAAGLVAFGVYSIADARYRRI